MRNKTAETKLSEEDPEKVAINFMPSIDRAISSFTDIDDDGALNQSSTEISVGASRS